MNSSQTNIKNLGMVFAVSASLFLAATPSHALIVNLTPIDFSNGGGTIDTAPFDSGINTISGSEGFDNYFNSTYLLLGADNGDTNISDSPASGDSVAFTGNTFEISSTDATNGVTFAFDWAFQGTESGVQDEFFISFINTTLTQSFDVFNKESPGYGEGTESLFLTNLTPGDYELEITLNEAGGRNDDGNTAAGFDNITVSSVPFEFSPSVGLIMMGGIFAFSRYAKSRKVKQELENI
ncbi:MAG: hypothetical protein QNJ55_08490 [Xenococcus sp. MO_188.B8]|nr:hypothetical protein [Xenococcus sp. MO_188.B8]